MKIIPLFDKVVVEQAEAQETTKSGFILPSASQEKQQLAKVIAVGPGGLIDGKEVVMQVKVGDTVLYSNYDMLRETLEYDFEQEKKTDYSVLNADMAVKQICKFVSGIWQIHPFREGNTRTIAVFTMKWLQTFGFSVDNDVFKDNSWYFRNALVRANYNNIPKRIFATSEYLELFFRNLLFGEQNKLSNRTMLAGDPQSATQEISKSQNGTLNGTLSNV